MAITINNKNVPGTAWGDIDKDDLRNRLQAALAEGVAGAVDAIRECYAAIRGETLEDAPSENWLLPHHNLNRNNVLVLVRSGMIAAAAALAGARADPNLTAEQKRQAARHLLRHYRQEEVNLQPPQSLLDLAAEGEMSHIVGRIAGEMRPTDIPLAPGVSILALKAGDPDPMEVVVEIPSGTNVRGWIYGKVVIRHLAEQMAGRMFAGYLGHQKEENLQTEFPVPVTHWVGAIYRDGSVFVRGVVDKAASDLKRWIRAGVVTQVSIFGHISTEVRGGETHVTGIELLSLDWTPLDRAGMKTRLVAVGEMDDKLKEVNRAMTLAEILAELRKLGAKPAQVVGEMGWDVKVLAKELGWELDKVASEISAERWGQLLEAVKAVGEIAGVFGMGKEAKLSDLLVAVKAAREAQQKIAVAEHDKLVDKVIGEMVQAEAVRPLVKRMLHVQPEADEAAVKKAAGEMLESKDVKDALASLFKDAPITPKGDDRGPSGSGNVTIKKVRI